MTAKHTLVSQSAERAATSERAFAGAVIAIGDFQHGSGGCAAFDVDPIASSVGVGYETPYSARGRFDNFSNKMNAP
jgi:hypothetical protein